VTGFLSFIADQILDPNTRSNSLSWRKNRSGRGLINQFSLHRPVWGVCSDRRLTWTRKDLN